MALIRFPDPRLATPEGLVVIGGTLDRQNLKAAYAKGVFPWPQPGLPMLWFSPPQRGVLEFASLHVPRSLKKAQQKAQTQGVQYVWGGDFRAIIEKCAATPRPGQDGTWITKEVIKAYCDLFAKEEAWCVGAYREGRLVGGVYGVKLSSYVTAESMFFIESNQSKLCLLYAVERLTQLGFSWLDVQMVTEVTQSLGAKLIDRDDFLDRIKVEK